MAKYPFRLPASPFPPSFCTSLSISSTLSQFDTLSCFLPPPPLPLAFRGELQSQLFVLELLQTHHDGSLVDARLSSAGYQPHTHHLLLHAPHQLCGAHGPRGGQGRFWSQSFIIWLEKTDLKKSTASGKYTSLESMIVSNQIWQEEFYIQFVKEDDDTEWNGKALKTFVVHLWCSEWLWQMQVVFRDCRIQALCSVKIMFSPSQEARQLEARIFWYSLDTVGGG